MMYSEMEFYYRNINYGVILYGNGQIEFFQDQVPDSLQIYRDAEDFKAHASIDGKLLKDIWKDVTKADYMQG